MGSAGGEEAPFCPLLFLPGPPRLVPKTPTGARVLPRFFCKQNLLGHGLQGFKFYVCRIC